MGKRRGGYNADFPVGTIVRIADGDFLVRFREEWKWHHPLEVSQLAYAGRVAKVKDVSYYHGGDELYELAGIPGIWHEACLEPAEEAQEGHD
jgi:hypothetical protein